MAFGIWYRGFYLDEIPNCIVVWMISHNIDICTVSLLKNILKTDNDSSNGDVLAWCQTVSLKNDHFYRENGRFWIKIAENEICFDECLWFFGDFFDNKPVWVRTCLFRSNESLNPLLQYAHLYFLYGEWFRRWRLSIRTCLKHLPQISHLNSEPWLWPPWTEPDPHEGDIECLWWWLRLADGWNFKLDMSHISESFCMISFGRLSKRS